MRRWSTALLAGLVVLDLVVLAFGVRARSGHLPPLQRHSAEFEPASVVPSSAPATTEADTGISAPLLLAANAAGLVVRATRGACEERFDNPAKAWVGTLDTGADLTEVDLPVEEVLGLVVAANGDVRLSGLDEACDPVSASSKDDGASWQATDQAAVWALKGDVQQASVTRPAGTSVDLDCPPHQIVNLPGLRAIASCEDSSFYVLQPSQGPTALSAAGYSSLSVTSVPGEERYYVFGATEGCGAQVGRLTPGDEAPTPGACLTGNRAPLAIAVAGDRLVVQVGNELMVSDDQGASFAAAGQA